MQDGNEINQLHQRLCAMADIGAAKELIMILLEDEKLKADHIKYLTGPIVQHKSNWMDITPEWLKQAVFPERLRIVLKEHREGRVGWEVGPAEITTVMIPATMEAPMHHDHAYLYFWASANATARHQNKTPEYFYSQLGMESIPDKAVLEPSGTYYYTYQRLASDIRRRVIKNVPKVERRGKTKLEPDSAITQINLFRERD